MKILSLLLLCILPCFSVLADVVKPALIEINVNKDNVITIEVRASIEALLTGINASYKNTKDAPNADEYDEFRQLSADDLQQAFITFKPQFLDAISLRTDNEEVSLAIEAVSIPPTGYTKVPRISVIHLVGELPASSTSLQWHYPAKFGDNAVRLRQVDQQNQQWHWSQWQWLRNDEFSSPLSLTEIVARLSVVEVITGYMILGFEHILPRGLDHLLFILGLFLLSSHWRPLLLQVTMFTVAHTITLGLAMNNVVQLPSNIVEPLIALSIAYVGVENLVAKRLHKTRLILVFVFGLIHGLGFAGVLADFGMPDSDFLTALISFNVGVELGQISTIILAYVLLRLWFKDKANYHRFIVVPGSFAIAVIGVIWFFERLELF